MVAEPIPSAAPHGDRTPTAPGQRTPTAPDGRTPTVPDGRTPAVPDGRGSAETDAVSQRDRTPAAADRDPARTTGDGRNGGPAPAFATVMADVATTSDRGSRRAAVIIAFGWHLAINLPAVVNNWSAYRLPWVSGLGWLVFVAVGAISAASLLRGTRAPVWPLIGVLLLVDAAVFAVTPGSMLFGVANWCWGTIGWFVVMVLWGRRIFALVAVFAVGAVIALVAVVFKGNGSAADLSRFVMYVYGTSTLPIAFSIAAGLLRTVAASTAGTAAARSALEAERVAARQAQADRRERLSVVSETAGAVLAELADGRADPTDPTVQRRCALEAARLRRLIAESDDVPDPLLHELRASVDIAERNGLPVELVAVGTLPPLPVDVRRRLAEPLTGTLAAARQWARLTVVGQPEEVIVSLITPSAATDPTGTAPSRMDDGEVEYVYERDEELVWAQTRWRAP